MNGTSCQCAAGFGGENCNLAFCECHAHGVVLPVTVAVFTTGKRKHHMLGSAFLCPSCVRT